MSRSTILSQIKRHKPVLKILPFIPTFNHDEIDLVEHFKRVLLRVGGQAIEIDEKDLGVQLKEQFGYLKFIISNDKTLGIETLNSNEILDPRELKMLELVVLRCGFGVAENAAVWISSSNLSHRVLPFIAEHSVFIVPKKDLVWNMHEAYKRIVLSDSNGFGVFVSGPSKTADIEQSLVIGAHGAKSLIVYLI
jgi:L-lactate dehydrogenase complex protein LldG